MSDHIDFAATPFAAGLQGASSVALNDGTYRRGAMLVRSLAAVAASALLASAVFASTPKPPRLCNAAQDGCAPTASEAPQSAAMKWHPGNYVNVSGDYAQADQQRYFRSVLNQIESNVPMSPNFEGAFVIYGWGGLEKSAGQYDWTPIYDALAWLKAHNKQLMIELAYKCFHGDATAIVPADLRDQTAPTKVCRIAAVWRKPVMDRWIAFVQAAAKEFDGNPNVELVNIDSELCPSFTTPPSDFSDAGYATQWERLYDAASGAWKQTNVSTQINCAWSGYGSKLMEYAYERGIGIASPDSHDDYGNTAFRGERDAARDYRGTLAHNTVVSFPNLGGKDDILPLSHVQSLIDAGKMTHVSWAFGGKGAGGGVSDVVKWIDDARHHPYASCPTQYVKNRGGCRP